MKTIEIEELTKYYGAVRGIEGVSLAAEPGEILGFIGPNGAGKSTTIRTALGLLRPTSGTARILGRDVAPAVQAGRGGPSRDRAQLLGRVGYVPADVHAYRRIRVGRLLEITGRFYNRDCRVRTKELVGLLGIDVNRRFGHLSSGNRKKVGIAVAFLHSPEVVILDEPTNGLDPLIRAHLSDLLKGECERGTTILFSSHTLSEVQALCTRISVIRDGRIVESGPIADMRRTSVRRATVTGEATVLADVEEAVAVTPGMTVERREGATASVLLRGDAGPLLARLPLERLRDVRVEEPSLEELFLHYYDQAPEVPDA